MIDIMSPEASLRAQRPGNAFKDPDHMMHDMAIVVFDFMIDRFRCLSDSNLKKPQEMTSRLILAVDVA